MTQPISYRPHIPVDEYPTRWQRVQDLMVRLDLDLLLAYADDRATFGPAHARWLANFPVHFEPACIVLARTGQPVLLCGPESDQYALLAGRIPDVRVLREFTHPDEDYPFSRIQGLAEVVAELAGSAGAVMPCGVGRPRTDELRLSQRTPTGVARRGVAGCRVRHVRPARGQDAG